LRVPLGRGKGGVVVAFALSWVALGSCSNGPPLPSVSSCSANWRPITGRATWPSAPAGLAYANGSLYYPSNWPSSIVAALSPADLSTQTLPVTWPAGTFEADDIWVEGDHFLLAGLDQFCSLPLAGGTAQLVYDGRPAGEDIPLSQYQAFTETDFFWTDSTTLDDTTHVLRGPRSGGPPEQLGALPLVVGMAVGQDAIVLGGIRSAWAIPLDGGPLRALVGANQSFMGVDALGVYYLETTGDPDQARMTRSPPDGGPAQPFWPDIPRGATPINLWSDGQGGWIAVGGQIFDDGQTHLAVWLIDASGSGRLAACEASADDSAKGFFPTTAPAVTPNAIYLTTQYTSDRLYWEIEKISR
jgi:hypothetical protein